MIMSTLPDDRVNACVKQLHEGLSPASTEVREALLILRFLAVSKDRDAASSPVPLSFPPGDLEAVRRKFLDKHYAALLDRVVAVLANAEQVQAAGPAGRQALDELFLSGPPVDAFCALSDAVAMTGHHGMYAAGKAALLLEGFVAQRHRLADVFGLHSFGCSSAAVGPLTVDELVSRISSLPDRMANSFGKDTSPAFLPAAYVRVVADDIITVLRAVREELAADRSCSLVFLSSLVGKLCITGRAEMLCDSLLPTFQNNCQSDFIWVRICHRLIVDIPSRMQESFLVQLFLKVKWYKYLDYLLGNTVCENHNLRHLITNKLLFHKVFTQVQVLWNIIGYLASSPARRELYIQVLYNVVDVWSDASTIRRSSYDQHAYISRALVVCFAFLSDEEKASHRQSILVKMMNGIQEHIGSNSPAVRRLGMLVAELVTGCLNANASGGAAGDTDCKLKFEYDRDAEVDEIASLLTVPAEPPPGQDNDGSVYTPAAGSSDSQSPMDSIVSADQGAEKRGAGLSEALDSDDDLEPYDMSCDTPKSKVSSPMYLRDCMEGLITSEDSELVQTCLAAAERLVRNSNVGLKEVAAEFCKILLHLPNNFSLTNYEVHRHAAMVALLVAAPIEVASYLTGEFCAKNYTLKQRLDVLEALAAAAQELSQPTAGAGSAVSSKTSSTQGRQGYCDRTQAHSSDEAGKSGTEHWTEIVDERIRAKTRVFVHGPMQPPAPAVSNRFAPVAGHFFFPLLANLRKPTESSFDLLGEDSMVLVKFIVTLSKIMYAATNAPISVKMGRHLLDMVWAMRYHSDRSVRIALLFAFMAAFLAVPTHSVTTDFAGDVVEFKAWLDDLDCHEADPECRKMVVRAMQVLRNRVQADIAPAMES